MEDKVEEAVEQVNNENKQANMGFDVRGPIPAPKRGGGGSITVRIDGKDVVVPKENIIKGSVSDVPASKEDKNTNTKGNTTSKGKGKGGISIDGSYENTIKSYNKDVDKNREAVNESTQEAAKGRNFKYPQGKSEDAYISQGTVGKEKKAAERELEQAEQANKKYQGLVSGRDEAKEIRKLFSKALKRGDNKLNVQELQERIKQIDEDIEYYNRLAESGNTGDEIWSFDPNASPDYKKMVGSLEKEKAEIQKQIQRGEDFQNLVSRFNELGKKQGELLGYHIDEFGKWAAKEGSQDNKYQAEVASALFSKMNQIMEDGQVSPEELEMMDEITDNIDRLAQDERLNDENIQTAETKLDSAKAKYSYYLFDQIKAWAAFLIGLSQGNPQMVYSAMEQFNKKISDAEADYKAGEIKAFENNNVKDITGKADAQYTLEQLFPEIENEKLKRQFQRMDKAEAVQALRNSFRAFQGDGGDPDDEAAFKAWFTAQTAKESPNSIMGILGTLIQAGALNWDSLKSWASGQAKDGAKKAGVPLSKAENNTSGGMGSGLAGGILDSILASGKGQMQQQSERTKTARDKQGTVGQALASRLGGQGAAPQGGGTAASVNTSWGRA
jgi:hypothetical protein